MSNNNIIAEIKAPRNSFKKELYENGKENDKTPKAINLWIQSTPLCPIHDRVL